MSLESLLMYIDGEWVESHAGATFESYNPATGEAWSRLPDADAQDVDTAVRAAQRAFEAPAWAGLSATSRGKLLYRLGELVAEHAEELAQLESRDNGKLIRETRGQLAYLPEFFYYNAGLADKVVGETLPLDKPDMFGATMRVPLGVVAAIVPWNSPLYLTAIKLAPALAAGNTVVIKPSEHASASLIKLMQLVECAGFPAGVVNLITGFGPTTGAALTSHPLVRKIAFTGGAAAARHVVRNSAENFAQLSLELGGKSPNILFEDADLDSAINGVVAGVFAASGQSCVAGSRLLIQRSIYDEVIKRLRERARTIRIGDPANAETEMGPMATQAQLETVERMVAQAQADGAELLYGGVRPDIANGWYYTPTILACTAHDMPIMQEEVFGPVVAAIPFDYETEALRLANDSQFGLAAGIWTRDIGRAHRLCRDVRAGILWVNTYRAISAMAPIGGFGASGYGREGGIEAVYDYTELKTLWINLSTHPMPDPFVMR